MVNTVTERRLRGVTNRQNAGLPRICSVRRIDAPVADGFWSSERQ